MALFFSNVTVYSGCDETSFLMGGGPTTLKDLENWTKYKEFIAEHKNITEIKVDLYHHGEGEDYSATPEEIALIYIKMDRMPNWLNNLPTKIRSYKLEV